MPSNHGSKFKNNLVPLNFCLIMFTCKIKVNVDMSLILIALIGNHMLFHAINPNCTQKHDAILYHPCMICTRMKVVWSMLDCIGAAEECHVVRSEARKSR